MAERGRKIGDQVGGDVGPGALGNEMGLQETRRATGGWFDALAGSTAGDEGADGASHMRPPVVLGNSIEGFVEARVTSRGGVMVFLQNAEAKVAVLWHTNAVLEIPQVVTEGESSPS